MEELKVGDIVRIKSVDWYDEKMKTDGKIEHKNLCVIKQMRYYFGKEAKVVDVYDDGFVRLDIDDEWHMWWSDLFESIERPCVKRMPDGTIELTNGMDLLN